VRPDGPKTGGKGENTRAEGSVNSVWGPWGESLKHVHNRCKARQEKGRKQAQTTKDEKRNKWHGGKPGGFVDTDCGNRRRVKSVEGGIVKGTSKVLRMNIKIPNHGIGKEGKEETEGDQDTLRWTDGWVEGLFRH